jgi:VWFA-related protein
MAGWTSRGIVLVALATTSGVVFPQVIARAPGALEQSQQPPASIRVRVDRVNVGVIVTDALGKFVEGSRKEDFHLFDEGVEQPVIDFAAIDEPAQVVLLVESGPAVYLLEGGHLLAAASLLNGLAAGDRVAVVGYAERPLPLLGFTTDKQAAASALGQLRFNLGFGDLNLSSCLGAVLDGLSIVSGKKTVVLLSTGLDTSPPPAWPALLARLRTGDVRILSVSLGGELRNPAPPKNKQKVSPDKIAAIAEGFAEADARLKAISGATGGRAFFPRNAKEFSAAYSQIAQLVRHEYSLGFAPPVNDGKVHSIEVRVGVLPAAPGSAAYRVDHRQAYLAPPPPNAN